MSSGAELCRQFRVVSNLLERSRRAIVAVFANHAVDGGVFSELLNSGSEHDQLGAIGQRHARAVNCLVPQPGAVELLRIEVNNGFAYGPVEKDDVALNAEF